MDGGGLVVEITRRARGGVAPKGKAPSDESGESAGSDYDDIKKSAIEDFCNALGIDTSQADIGKAMSALSEFSEACHMQGEPEEEESEKE